MRLLGAGKTNSNSATTEKHKSSKSSTKVEEITHMQEDLEKQFEAGCEAQEQQKKRTWRIVLLNHLSIPRK